MSTKSKNPLLKRVILDVTQEIIDKSDVRDTKGCYFYNTIRPLVKDAYYMNMGYDWALINYETFPCTKAMKEYQTIGFNNKKLVPKKFAFSIPRKYLK